MSKAQTGQKLDLLCQAVSERANHRRVKEPAADIEKALVVWVRGQTSPGIPLIQGQIQSKALILSALRSLREERRPQKKSLKPGEVGQ